MNVFASCFDVLDRPNNANGPDLRGSNADVDGDDGNGGMNDGDAVKDASDNVNRPWPSIDAFESYWPCLCWGRN